jgi:glutathione peroxidase
VEDALSEDTEVKPFKKTASLGLAAAAFAFATVALAADSKEKDAVKAPTAAASPLDFTVKDIDGKEQKLADFKGKVVMIVNVASRCGNTPQYEGLEAMYQKYKDKGLVIIGFPANNFGGQEPGTEAQIKEFCTSKYNVTFPMMAKVSVKGDDRAPLYAFLTEEKTNPKFAGDVQWNFGKFLVGRDGSVVDRFDPGMKPSDPKLVESVEKALAAKAATEAK